jgi:ligand-binding sensor domain-containing protein
MDEKKNLKFCLFIIIITSKIARALQRVMDKYVIITINSKLQGPIIQDRS